MANRQSLISRAPSSSSLVRYRPDSRQSNSGLLGDLKTRLNALTPGTCAIYDEYVRAPGAPRYFPYLWHMSGIHNVYEMVVRTTKVLEHLLTTEFSASGNGLSAKISSLSINPEIKKRLMYLVGLRNRLVHDVGVDNVPNGPMQFAAEFDDLSSILHDHLVYRVLSPIIGAKGGLRRDKDCDARIHKLFWSKFFTNLLRDALNQPRPSVGNKRPRSS